MEMCFVRLEYVGDGKASRLISIGFRPHRVYIFSEGCVSHSFITTSTETIQEHSANKGIVCSNASQINVGIDYLQSIGGVQTNKNGAPYILYAFG